MDISKKSSAYDPFPVLVLSDGSVVEKGCMGCPNTRKIETLFNVDFDGPGPKSLMIGEKVLEVCCENSEVVVHYDNMVQETVYLND